MDGLKSPGTGDRTLRSSERIDEACDRFEAACRAGQAPRIEDYVAEADEADRSGLLGELVALEHELRCRRGERKAAEEYHARFPENCGLINQRFAEPGALGSRTQGPAGARGSSWDNRTQRVPPEEGGAAATEPGSGMCTAPDPSTRDDGLPGSAGRYELLGEIARGGMGAVLKARDRDLGRDLAVKVLADPRRADLAWRFLEEARITGQLQHPGIPPVHELSTLPDGRPFFAMKLIKGRTLAELLRDRPDPSAELPRFLTIFEQVAQTVAYAHSRGVIHRDLKPSNIMVGAFGEVQVMDWGLAKVLGRPEGEGIERESVTVIRTPWAQEPDSATRANAVLGTPAYMAPEQARGETDRVDERADVFGLGAILCEILTGRPPYTGKSSDEIADKAALADQAEALERLTACAADEELTGLARSCVAPRPEDRPRHAGAVATTLTIYLEGVSERLRRAELARVEAQARAEEERKRRRLAIILAASVLALAVVGGGGGVWLARERADRARREAAERDVAIIESLTEVRSLGQDDADGVERDVGYAAAFRRHGFDVETSVPGPVAARLRSRPPAVVLEVAGALDDWASLRRAGGGDRPQWDKLVRMAQLIDPDPWRNEVREALELTDRAQRAARIKKLVAEFRVEEQPAATLVLLARALADVEDYPEAVRVLRGAVRYYPGDVWVNFNLGITTQELRPVPLDEDIRYLTAAGALRRVTAHELGHALEQRGRKQEAIEVFRDLTRFDRDRRGVGRHYICLGRALGGRSGSARAVEAFQSAIAAYRPRVQAEPDFPSGHLGLATALHELGSLEEAISEYREALRLRPDEPSTLLALGNALASNGQFDEAIASYRAYTRLRPQLAFAHFKLGLALSNKNAWDEAIAEYREALRLQPDFQEVLINLGGILSDRGSLDDAIALFRKALWLDNDRAVTHVNLAITLRRKGLSGEAITEGRTALRLQPDFPKGHAILADALMDEGSLDEAVVEYREALRQRTDFPEARRGLDQALERLVELEKVIAEHRAAVRLRPNEAEAHFKLANVLASKEATKEAITEYRQALQLRPNYLDARGKLAQALLRDGQLDSAGAAFQTYGWGLREVSNLPGALEALREAVRLLPKWSGARCNLSEILLATGDSDGALHEAREAVRLEPNYPYAHAVLGTALLAKGDRVSAIAAYREVIRLNPASAAEHWRLGGILRWHAGDLPGAITEFREAIRLDPNYASAHASLGEALNSVGDPTGGAAELRESIRLDPNDPHAHYRLAFALRTLGDYAGSEASIRRSHELGSKIRGWSAPTAEWLGEAERLSALERRLPAVIRGKDRPIDGTERLTMADMAARKQLHAAAVRLYEEAFAAQPALADDLRAGHRLAAARCAAQSGTGAGKDDPPPDAETRARLRALALDWLRADLTATDNSLDAANEQTRSGIRTRLHQWRADAGFKAVRESKDLDQLPDAERGGWRKFWGDVDSLFSRAGASAKPSIRP
jgi:serine/threonine-protein kinase